MKSLFWLVGLFATAVALALLMGQNGATVTLFWAPYRVDMSFNLVLAGVLLVFFLLHVALRSLSMLRSLPRQAQRWRMLQRERAVHAALLDALSHQLAGRFVRARSAARQAIEQMDAVAGQGDEALPRQAQMHAVAHLLAAEAAHTLQDHGMRDRHLAQVLKPAPSADTTTVREGALLRAIRWAVEDRSLESATRWLAQLPQGASRRTLALRLRLRVARLAQDHTMALETARLLAKHKAFSETASRSILRGLLLANLRGSHDPDQVRATWKVMDAKDRQDPELVLAAIARLQEVSQDDADQSAEVTAWCREWVLPIWDQYPELQPSLRLKLVNVLQGVLHAVDATWLARIENMQREHPADPVLQHLAAQIFYQQKLWGKAHLLFQQAAHGLSDPGLRVQTWARLAQLADMRGDEAAALQAWRQAALQSSGYGMEERTSGEAS